MKSLYRALIAVFFVGAVHAATPATPDAVVTEMYQTYYDALNAVNASNGSMDNMPSVFDQVPKYATPELSARMNKAATADEMVIDADFLVNGQDFQDLKILSVKTTASDDKTATVRIETSNFDAKSITDVLLAKTDAGWKVSDFIFSPGTAETYSLDQILKDAGL